MKINKVQNTESTPENKVDYSSKQKPRAVESSSPRPRTTPIEEKSKHSGYVSFDDLKAAEGWKRPQKSKINTGQSE